MRLWMSLIFLLLSPDAIGAAVDTVASDGVQQVYSTEAKTYFIGDLHGEFRGFAQELLDLHLIDDELNWIGRQNHLVLAGDYFAGADDSRLILDLIMKIEPQAQASGGGVHGLIGNHDLLVANGQLDHLSEKEKSRYTKYPIDGQMYTNADLAIRTTKYGAWLSRQNQAVIINKVLFTHAGFLPEHLENVSLGEINLAVRSYIKSWLQQPAQHLRWVVGVDRPSFNGESGASWFRGFKLEEDKLKKLPSRAEFKRFLQSLGVNVMAVGHAPTPDSLPVLMHPLYGPMLVMADTRISDEENGTLSAVVFDANGRSRALHFKREDESKFIRKATMKQLKSSRNTCQQLFNSVED